MSPPARIAALIAAVCVLACAGAPRHEHEIAEGWHGAPGIGRVLLAPMNATGEIDPQIQAGAERIRELTAEYLSGQEMAVETVRLRSFRRAWVQAFTGVQLDPEKPEVPREAIANLVATLRERHDFDLLIMPMLEVRTARLSSKRARWDGVSRKMTDKGRYRDFLIRPDHFPALSLRVRVYSETGERVFQGVGGLDLVHEISRDHEQIVVDAPLADEEHLAEGVRIAFDPFIPFSP